MVKRYRFVMDITNDCGKANKCRTKFGFFKFCNENNIRLDKEGLEHFELI